MHWPLPKMSTISLHHRLATRDDIVALTALMNAAIGELQKPFLTDAQIASSRAIMGLDTSSSHFSFPGNCWLISLRLTGGVDGVCSPGESQMSRLVNNRRTV